jgi:hypothetical protein
MEELKEAFFSIVVAAEAEDKAEDAEEDFFGSDGFEGEAADSEDAGEGEP